MPSEGYEGHWIIADNQVEVNDKTVIDETAGRALQGSEVRVTGTRSGNIVKASEICIMAGQ